MLPTAVFCNIQFTLMLTYILLVNKTKDSVFCNVVKWFISPLTGVNLALHKEQIQSHDDSLLMGWADRWEVTVPGAARVCSRCSCCDSSIRCFGSRLQYRAHTADHDHLPPYSCCPNSSAMGNDIIGNTCAQPTVCPTAIWPFNSLFAAFNKQFMHLAEDPTRC